MLERAICASARAWPQASATGSTGGSHPEGVADAQLIHARLETAGFQLGAGAEAVEVDDHLNLEVVGPQAGGEVVGEPAAAAAAFRPGERARRPCWQRGCGAEGGGFAADAEHRAFGVAGPAGEIQVVAARKHQQILCRHRRACGDRALRGWLRVMSDRPMPSSRLPVMLRKGRCIWPKRVIEAGAGIGLAGRRAEGEHGADPRVERMGRLGTPLAGHQLHRDGAEGMPARPMALGHSRRRAGWCRGPCARGRNGSHPPDGWASSGFIAALEGAAQRLGSWVRRTRCRSPDAVTPAPG